MHAAVTSIGKVVQHVTQMAIPTDFNGVFLQKARLGSLQQLATLPVRK
jgi:hypothetical protein